jgi:hypothetical protein
MPAEGVHRDRLAPADPALALDNGRSCPATHSFPNHISLVKVDLYSAKSCGTDRKRKREDADAGCASKRMGCDIHLFHRLRKVSSISKGRHSR